jgi:peptide/nickel transport system ATP-binding protein
VNAILQLCDASYRYRGGSVALQAVSFAVDEGQNIGLVGESGAGKTTLLRLLLGLAAPTSGSVMFDGVALDRRNRERMVQFRRSVQTVFQDPYASLDPRQSIGRSVSEPLRSLGIATGADARARVEEALNAVGLPADSATRYPHEFSGGQRQRVAIARAVVGHPRVLLADEPVSALDMTTRIQVLDLLAELGQNNNLTVVMVSHDLGAVAALCSRIVVLQRGRVVEQGDTSTVLAAPAEPYTRTLLASVPRLPSV